MVPSDRARATHELVYVAPSRLRQALIASQLDDLQSAGEAFSAAERLWQDAAPGPRLALAETARRLSQTHPAPQARPGRVNR
ncbi:MAG TPA: hypothetical protein VF981_17000 [Gemmatimonadaceae bacterium]